MSDFSRRQLLGGASLIGGGLALTPWRPSFAQSISAGVAPLGPEGPTPDIDLIISNAHAAIDGKAAHLVTANAALPGPLLRFKQGRTVKISVKNLLQEDTSIHWHGLLPPFQFDGVPGVSFPGIKPGQTFVYELPITQSGSYWYHSHSGMQEQEGLYGPILIDPEGDDPVHCDRDHVIMLSDYSFIHPHKVFERLKQEAGVFNNQKQTVASLLAGEDQSYGDRLLWSRMRMDPTDISDVTGAVLTFLINGHGPRDNWTGLFTPGEQVRLRFINAASQTPFNIRIPGLKLKIVAADGQLVQPVDVDEFQISNAETYDVIVNPMQDRAFTLVAEAVDRSGMARATLAPRPGMTAAVPALRKRPLASMRDMGMDMSAMGQGGMQPKTVPAALSHGAPLSVSRDASRLQTSEAPSTTLRAPASERSDLPGPKPMGGMPMPMPMSMSMPMSMPTPMQVAPKDAGVALGPGVEMVAPMPTDRTAEPGVGLDGVGHKVLVYQDLVALQPNPDQRTPSRVMDIHLTGNMERFIWGFDGKTFAETPKPYSFARGERVRINLINDTMMAHPIHLHGHFFELIHGPKGHHPRKHTVNVLPSGKVTFDFTAAPGDWAFHCHMLYHMHAGMFQVFSVRPLERADA